MPTTSPTVQNPPRKKVLWASLVGTSLESYDFYVFSYLSAFFIGPLFFTPLGTFGGFLAGFLTSTLFPYTTLFRSAQRRAARRRPILRRATGPG